LLACKDGECDGIDDRLGGLRSCTAGVCFSMSTTTTGAAVTGAIDGPYVTGADDGGDDWRRSSPGM
jgi:hypothetical protein